jgi:hypothetical protein
MTCGTFTTTNIPTQAQANAVAASYKQNIPAPTSVTVQQVGSTWTVTATWPPCPPSTTHSSGSS